MFLNLSSMAMKEVLYLRVLSLCANIIYVIYGLLLHATPFIIGCAIAVGIHVYHIHKMAKENGKVAGTIGLMNKGNGLCILKKFFVYEPYRGRPHNLGRQLYSLFLEFARTHRFSKVILDTPKNTDRAHLFYEKAGFKKIDKEELPVEYDYPYDDSDFFCLTLNGRQ